MASWLCYVRLCHGYIMVVLCEVMSWLCYSYAVVVLREVMSWLCYGYTVVVLWEVMSWLCYGYAMVVWQPLPCFLRQPGERLCYGCRANQETKCVCNSHSSSRFLLSLSSALPALDSVNSTPSVNSETTGAMNRRKSSAPTAPKEDQMGFEDVIGQ